MILSRRERKSQALALSCTVLCTLFAWLPQAAAQPRNAGDLPPSPAASAHERSLVSEVVEPDLMLELQPTRSKIIRTRFPVARTSIVDSTIAEVTQFGPNELEISGIKEGSTDLTFWFAPTAPDLPAPVLRYRVRVGRDSAVEERRQREYGDLEDMLNEMFPNSSIELVVVADKLIVKGQARDSEEVANIMSLLRKQALAQTGQGNLANLQQGVAAEPYPGSGPLPTSRLISLLRVPGEQQVLLKVRVAELSRSALREVGLDFSIDKENLVFSSMLGNAGNIMALLDNGDVTLLLKAISSNSHSKVLAEPNLVTLSGRTASFIAGGQFAVPTIVGVSGAQGVSTEFQGFGTQLQFTPTVIDKDRIRLRVVPTLSSINNANTVNGIPGLNTRSVFTTVDMREGQWLAIAGLLQDEQTGTKARIPGIGDLPLGNIFFGNSSVQRNETELLILVSPQLVHPLGPGDAPQLLPGMEVKEPTDAAFFLAGKIEGPTDVDHRSTVWPAQQTELHRAIKANKQESRYQQTQKYYLANPHGFSE